VTATVISSDNSNEQLKPRAYHAAARCHISATEQHHHQCHSSSKPAALARPYGMHAVQNHHHHQITKLSHSINAIGPAKPCAKPVQNQCKTM
jgi:hypothetical protein